MSRSRLVANAVAVTFVSTLCFTGTAHATLWWYADPAKGNSVFRSIEFQDNNNNFGSTNGSSVTLVSGDNTTVRKFHKDDLDRRCEAKGAAGITVTRGVTYYIGWRLKTGSLTNNNSYFQWKSYGSPMTQNYPVVIKMINGELNLEHYSDGQVRHTLWHHSIAAGTWYSLVLKIKTSDDASVGNVQFWFGNDTTPETLTNGSTSYTCKTFDGSEINPKWGYYGETNTNEDAYVGRLKIGSTYDDVRPW